MKREIKFNAWDGSRMLKNVGTHPHMIKSLVKIPNCENQDGDCEYTPGTEGSIIVCQKFDSYTLIQFTGLKDKNGKEIYEGDVLNKKTSFEDNWADRRFQSETEIQVGFEDGYFMDINTRTVLFERMMTVSSYPQKYWTDYEVIGNVYENPDLR